MQVHNPLPKKKTVNLSSTQHFLNTKKNTLKIQQKTATDDAPGLGRSICTTVTSNTAMSFMCVKPVT